MTGSVNNNVTQVSKVSKALPMTLWTIVMFCACCEYTGT
jgi:hypothetical protein